MLKEPMFRLKGMFSKLTSHLFEFQHGLKYYNCLITKFHGTYSVNNVVYLIRTKNKIQNHSFYDLFYKKMSKLAGDAMFFYLESRFVMKNQCFRILLDVNIRLTNNGHWIFRTTIRHILVFFARFSQNQLLSFCAAKS